MSIPPAGFTAEQLATRELELQEDLLRLKLARMRMKHYAEYVFSGYKAERHQDLIMEKLEQVEKYIASGGKEGIGKLIINIPPGHGKTLLTSILFPSWVIGRNPDTKVILASYGASLSEKSSRDMRNIVDSFNYQKIFGRGRVHSSGDPIVEVDPEGRSIQSWEINGQKGGVVAAGVGGPLIGRRTHLFVIDDPHKDRAEAESEQIRSSVWDWYTSVALTRLENGGAVVIIMQRWHEDDLVGRLLDREGAKWEQIILPAFAEMNDPLKRIEGEVLWPNKFSKEFLLDYKSICPPRDWNSMYQQSPSGEDGEVFSQQWFSYGDLPPVESISYGIQVWDVAMTEKTTSDYSACVTAFVTDSGVFIADVFRARLQFPDLKRMMFEKHAQWCRYSRIGRIYIENKVAGISMLQSLKKDSNLPVIALEPESKMGRDKVNRAKSVSGYVQSGRVVFQRGAPWLHEFESELLKFPTGKHDDMVDAFAYTLIQTSGGGVKKKASLTKYRQQWYNKRNDRLSLIMGGSM